MVVQLLTETGLSQLLIVLFTVMLHHTIQSILVLLIETDQTAGQFQENYQKLSVIQAMMKEN